MSVLTSWRAIAAEGVDPLPTVSPRIVERYYDDPVGFVLDCVKFPVGKSLRPYQAEVLDAIYKHRKVAVVSMHGVGKTATDALAAIHFSVTREAAGVDWKVITTAGAWRQLERYLWPEIRLWARRLRWDVLGQDPWTSEELLALSLKLRHGTAFAVAASDPALIEGAHAEQIFYIFDESKAIDQEIFNAAEGAFSSGEAFALANSTPGEPVGTFYDIHARRPGFEDWWTRHISLDEALACGAINEDWVDQRRRQWGESSALFQNRVLGEFAANDEDGVIPLAWVEQAQERWVERKRHWFALELRRVGVDVARGGADDTVIAPYYDQFVEELRYFHGDDTMTTAGRVVGLLQSGPNVALATRDVYATIDTDGLGAGVTDRVREVLGSRQANAFHGGMKTERRDRSHELGFVNKRSAAWWHLREELDPSFGATLCLPPDDRLTGELCLPKWSVVSDGKIKVESKDDIKKRTDGHSPDAADAVVYAVWPEMQRRARMTWAGRAA